MNKLPDFTKEGKRMFVSSNRIGFTADPDQALRVSGALVVAPGVTRSIERQINKHREALWEHLLDKMEERFALGDGMLPGDCDDLDGMIDGITQSLSILVYGDTSKEHLASIAKVAEQRYDSATE